MKKALKIAGIFGFVWITFLIVSVQVNPSKLNIEAGNELFTLGPVPTVNHEVASNNAVNVSTITQYIDAVNNPSVDVINFTTNITAAATGQAMALSVDRDLRINGNGFTLTLAGNAAFGPAGGGSASGTHLLLGGTGGTIHLENLTLNRTTVGSGQNDFMSIMTSTNQTWDIIFDNFTSTFSSNQWRSITRTVGGNANSARIFLRNNSNLNLGAGSTVFATNGVVVCEPNSNVNLTARSGSGVLGLADGDTKLYVAANSNLTLGVPPQIWSGNRGVLSSVNEVNIYPSASLQITGTGNATTPALTSLDSLTEMVFRVDTDATLTIENTVGPALISTGSFPIRILGNAGSTVDIKGNGTTAATQMTATNSALTLVAPKSYNIQNRGTGIAFSGIDNTTATLSLTNTNIGVWLRGQSITGNPQLPTPFSNVNLVTGSTSALAGSSAILDTIGSGWNTSNYNRISYASIVEIDANDLTLGLGRNKTIESTVTPSNAPLTYTSNNTGVVSVDSNGNVFGVAQGSTTITISSSGIDGFFPSSTTITVTVTNNEPVLQVPSFTVVPIGDDFDPMLNVTATDVEDGDLTSSVQVNNPVDTNIANMYVVSYSVTDFNNNTVTAEQVVLVKDDSFVIGDNTVIQASDFSKRPSQVDTSDTAIKSAAQVKVYDKTTGLELVNEPVTITNKGGYTNVVGTYPISFEVTSDPVATITIQASVVAGNAPQLSVPAFSEVAVGGSFDPKTGVSVSDVEDTLTLSDVTVVGSVNVNVAGVYILQYSVSDSDGNTTTAKQVVLVKDDSFVAGDNTIIEASDFSKRPSQVDTSDAAIKSAAQVKVYDKTTGLELVNEPVTITNNGGYTNVVGTYPISFEVTSDPVATITIQASVVTGNAPQLSVPAFSEVAVGGSFDPKTGVSVSDVEDTLTIDDVVISGSVNVNVAGVYTLNYSVSDSDGNITTAKQVVLVKDDSFVAGDNTILEASDFSKRPSQVDTSDAAIKSAAQVKVYDKTTGLELVNEPVTITNNGGYTNVVGSYTISFEVTSDPVANITIQASVVAGNAPQLSVPAFSEVAVGGSFDPKTGVSVSDVEDTLTLSDVTVVGSVNVNVAGVYILQYSVSDSDGNTTTAKQVVLVYDDSFVAGDNTILEASDFSKRPSQVDTSDAAIKSAAQVKVYDKTTGLELVNEPVTITNNGGYTNVVGTYPISFEVTSDPVATITIQASVVTGNAPQLSVPAFSEVAVGGSFDPKTGVTVSDVEDTLTIDDVVISGSVNVNVAGVYTLNYSVSDSDGNITTAKQVVLVKDDSFVAGDNTILEASDFSKRPSQVDTSDAAIKSAAQVKVYDKTTGLELVNEPVTITNNGGYTNVVGTYPISFEVTSDPVATITIQASVVAGNAPQLSVPAFSEVAVGGSFDPKTGVSVSDVEDTLTLSDVTVVGSVNVNVAGVYILQYSVSDSDGNTTTAKQVVLVYDDSFVVGDNTIIEASDFSKRPSQVDTSDAAIKSAAQVKVYDKTTGLELVNEPVTITNNGGYTNVVGTYPISFEVTSDPVATITIQASVVTGNAPQLSVPAFSEVAVGGSFDPKTGVSVSDVEDTLTIDDVVISGSVNVNVAGVYTLNYSVSDSDGNTTTAKQVVLVKDDSFVAGDNTILEASDFSKRPSQVDTSDAAIKSAAQVKVYDKLTGQQLVNEPVTITNKGGYTNVVGTYPISFEVTSDSAATITIQASVVTGNAPQLSVPAFSEVAVGGSFDPKTGVSVSDVEDTLTIDDVVISGSVNVNVAGVYTLNYSVSDSDGNTTTAKQVVLVKDDSFVAGDNTIIQASDFSKRPSQVDTSDAAIKSAAQVKVYDKTTGLELVNEPVTITNNGGYTNVVGTYPISFEVTSDPVATITIQASVVAGNAPQLSVPAFSEVAVGGSFDPKTGVSVSDVEDTLTLSDVTVVGSVNVNVAGVYILQYSVTDSDGNTTTAKQVVLVYDDSFVAGDNTILEASDFSKRPSQVDTSDAAIKSAAQVKVYDKTTGLELVNEPVTITNNGGYTNVVGTYPISFEVTSDPVATITIQASVVTGNAPQLSVPAFSEVAVGGSFDPKAGVTVSDVEDALTIDDVVISGSVNVNVAGVYTLNYSVSDSDGNTTTAKQVVLVKDDSFVAGDNTILEASDFSKRPSQVDTSDAAIKSAAQVKVYDKTTGLELVNEPVTITNKGGYTNVVGTYPISFEVTSDPVANITIQASVVTGETPVLTVNPLFLEIDLHATFDVMKGVSAIDTEDGDITSYIDITNPVKTSVAGVYAVTYHIQDSDGNEASLVRTVVVQDDSFVVGTSTIIHATHFTKRISDVDTSDAAIKEAAQVRVYDKQTGQELVNEPVTIVGKGGYNPAVGTYPITFSVTRDVASTITILATVETGNIPVLTVPPLSEIALNGSFDPSVGVSASDEEDGDLTSNIIIEENTVRTDVVGVYHVRYSVTDSDGNRVEATQVVVVNDGELIIGESTILFASDFTKRVGQVTLNANAIKSAAQVKVFDIHTGQEIVGALVNIVDLGGYHAAVGTYSITFEVAGDPLTTNTVQANVISGQAPVLTVPAFRETTQGTNFDVKTGVSAMDEEDGDLTSQIQVVGEFDTSIPGVYTLQYSITDSDGNHVSKNGVILVNNDEFFVGDTIIIQASDFERRIGQVDTSDAAVIEAANVKLYDRMSGKEIENPQIVVLNLGGYTASEGTYTIEFGAQQDPSAVASITATVTSGDAPDLIVPAFREIQLNENFDPMDGVSAYDTHDGNLTDNIIVTGEVDNTVAGVYTIHYQVTDTDNNVSEAVQVVLVQDGTFTYGDDYIISAQSFNRRVSQVDLDEVAILDAALVRVFDKNTGEELTVADVKIADLGGYQAAVGTYPIRFEVINDASTNITIEANVYAGNKPILTVPTLSEVELNGAFDPMAGVIAYDVEDGLITNLVQVTGVVDVNTVGIYTLHYQVQDRDGNVATAQQLVIVSDGEIVVGDRTILRANSFEKRVGQVDTSDAAILQAAEAKVYDRLTGLELVDETISVVYKGGYHAAVGTYPITLEVTSDPNAKKIITANVISGSIPILTVTPTFMELAVGDTFDPQYGISASDEEDGDITTSIMVNGTVDTSTPGVYPVHYSVEDSDSNQVEMTRVVVVNDDSFIIGNETIITANDFTKRVGQVDLNPSVIKQAANVRVYDKFTGEWLVNEPVNITNPESYQAIVGVHPINFQVARDALAQQTIEATVSAGEKPVLNVPTFTEIELNSAFNPKTGISAIDYEDGDITSKIELSGFVDVTRAGIYTLNYSVTDSDFNMVSVKRIVLVNDGSFIAGNETILEAQDFTKRLSEVVVDEASVKQAAQVKVFDKLTGVQVFDRSVQVSDFGGYKQTPGTYTIHFKVVEDPQATTSVVATVLTDTPPVLTVPNFTEIKLNQAFDPMVGVKAIDKEDGDITSNIKVTNPVLIHTAGIYTVKYEVIDSDNNKVTAIQTVLVNSGEYAYKDGFIIKASNVRIALSNANISNQQLIELAKVQVFDVVQQKWVIDPTITVDRGGLTNKVGEYTVTFTFNPSIQVIVSVYQDDNDTPGSFDTSNQAGYVSMLVLAGVAIFILRRKKVTD